MNTEYLKFDETGQIVEGCDNSVTNVVIPEGVTEIGGCAFINCTKLRLLNFA